MKHLSSEIYRADLRATLRGVAELSRLCGRTLLLTGASGLLGTWIADALRDWNESQAQPIRLILAGRDTRRLAERFGPEGEFLRYQQYDLSAPISMDIRADFIIHAAGNAHPASFRKDPAGTLSDTVLGAHRMLDFATHCGCERFLYVSSGEVYGIASDMAKPMSEHEMGFIDPLSPRACYPNGKRAAETLCAIYATNLGLHTVIARPCHCYGPSFTPTDDRASAQFIQSAAMGETIVLHSPGNQLRSWCYAADCASALLTALLHGHSAEAYNIAIASEEYTIAEFAAECARLGNSVLKREYTSIPMDSPIPHQVLNAEKLEFLGWRGQFTADIGIEHSIGIIRDWRALYSLS